MFDILILTPIIFTFSYMLVVGLTGKDFFVGALVGCSLISFINLVVYLSNEESCLDKYNVARCEIEYKFAPQYPIKDGK